MITREELEKAIKDKDLYIDGLLDKLSNPEHAALTGLIKNEIEFHTEMKENYIKALAHLEKEEEIKKVGRPSKGITKKVSITLPDYLWDWMDEMVSDNEFGSRSAFIRRLVLDSYIELNRIGK